jgi:hypothetical protein
MGDFGPHQTIQLFKFLSPFPLFKPPEPEAGKVDDLS